MVFHGKHKRRRKAGRTLGACGRGRAVRGALAVAIAATTAGTCWAASLGPASARLSPAGPHATMAARAKAPAPPHRSGLAWASGVYLPNGTPAAAAAFAKWRGHPLDVVEVWLNDSSWASITDPAWLYQRWAGSGYSMIFSVPMLPHARGVSIQACAKGAYNAHWRRFGKVIRSYGLGYSIIRLGWEFNGNWVRWSAGDPASWARCWRQVVTSARSAAPSLRWDWNVNRGVSKALADPARAYPGNGYVSMIGVDSYDWWPGANTAAGWQRELNGPQGLNYWLAFASAHGKRLSVPEWGNIVYGQTAGGDDPAYVWHMRAFFAANTSRIAFETNFQNPVMTGVSFMAGLVPRAARAYREGF
jgi:hypothetical protein